MAGDDYYSRELHGPYQLFDIGDFELEDGGKDSRLQTCLCHVRTTFVTESNAILILTECLPSPFETIHCTT